MQRSLQGTKINTMTCLRLILGDQLNNKHSWFAKAERTRADIIYVLMEVRSETDYVVHHAQKVLGIFAAMRAFAQALRDAGLRVHYMKINDADNQQDFSANLQLLAKQYNAHSLERQEADEYRLETLLLTAARQLGLPVRVVDSEHFLMPRTELRARFSNKTNRMEYFYRDLRKRYNILLDTQGQPLGGQWNYDQANRKRWNGTPEAPQWYPLAEDLSALWQDIAHSGVTTMGDPMAERFPWPIKRSQAKAWLAHFCRNGLAHFGAFQDAMSTASGTLFHAGISFALNTKMLHPLEVINAALAEFNAGRVSLATIEGFVRQILGWREFVRAIYWARMPAYANSNFFHHTAALPRWYWDGNTKMHCLQRAIKQSLTGAYAHHIQRLMLTGNFALLAGCDPDAVDAWYLGIYIDAFEWVEMPNTRGMSQYADGGILGSKPYTSTAGYINKMSDYCKNCFYKASLRHGDGACPFNSLYWHFHARHAKVLQKNPRIGMTYMQWQKIADDEQQLILAQAEHYLTTIDQL